MSVPLDHIDCWIFDLDNTLYSPSAKLFDLIDERMGAFIMRLLDCDAVEARRVQKQYFHDHGTTMAGLMRHHAVDPEHFLVDVHDIALDRILAPDARLRAGTRTPARTQAGLHQRRRGLLLHGVLDPRGSRRRCSAASATFALPLICPSPNPAAYATMITHLGIDPARSLFVEDMARNLTPAKALGMNHRLAGQWQRKRPSRPPAGPGRFSREATLPDWLDSLPAPWGIS